ncbi:MAG: anaerobic ribonucleoside-triphosphate reductase activating protein [Pseudomonadota bacterium]
MEAVRSRSGQRAALRIGGLTPLSLTDYPGQLAAVVFCQGCAWRCGYCHNPHLLPPRAGGGVEWRDVVRFLRRRVGLLDAVVFSGGEPTRQPGLAAAAAQARALGFHVGLHTAGVHPRRLEAVLPQVDWVGFDVKAPFHAYAAITGVEGSGAAALASLRLVLASGVGHEVRTTVHPALLPPAGLLELARTLVAMGVARFVVQEARGRGPDGRLPPARAVDAVPGDRLAGLFGSFEIRRA